MLRKFAILAAILVMASAVTAARADTIQSSSLTILTEQGILNITVTVERTCAPPWSTVNLLPEALAGKHWVATAWAFDADGCPYYSSYGLIPDEIDAPTPAARPVFKDEEFEFGECNLPDWASRGISPDCPED